MEKQMDLRVAKTYLSLHNAFTSLLEEKRFEDFTVNELCQRAMIRRTTFYKHFADKYEYFSFYINEVAAGIRDQFPPDILSDDVNQYFSQMGRELLRFIEVHQKLVYNVVRSNMFPVLLDSLSEQISLDVFQAMKKTSASRRMSRQQMEGVAAFYAGGLLNVLFAAMKRGETVDEEQLAQIIEEFSYFGNRTEEACCGSEARESGQRP